jgi:uncharacterized protein (TIGR03790 family)
MRKFISILTVLVVTGVAHLFGANPGDEVVIVYNTALIESRQVANYYAEKRGVPESQIFGFALTTKEDVSREEFQNTLQRPLAKILEARKLWHVASHRVPATAERASFEAPAVVQSRIRYAVLCYGVPLRIEEVPNLKEEGTEKLRPEMLRNEAAVDSELALLPLLAQNPPLAGPLRNPAFAVTNEAQLHPTNGVLLVARLDGPTPAIARGLVDKALQAEKDGLWGRAYFDLRNTTEPGYKLGDDWIRGASEICRRLGYETVVDEKPETFPAGFPLSQIAIYIGWYAGDACGPFAQPTVEFMPGAFAYHLFSFSAASIRTTAHYWVGPLLAKGATITMGCVWEPYLSGTPDVAVFTARLLYSGFTFGEAAYASQNVLSWQTTVVGDPLYRPCGRNPERLGQELASRGSDLVPWVYLRLVDVNLANGKPLASAVDFLEQLDETKRSAVLAEKLGDLYEAQGKPSSAVFEYNRALALSPSPQQQLRLRLTLGDKLAALAREPEAYGDYQELLREFPDYPDKLAIVQKLLPLAQKLKKTSDVEKYESEIKQLTASNKP